MEPNPSATKADTAKGGVVKAVVLHESAEVMRARFPELSELIIVMADLFLDFNMSKKKEIAKAYEVLGKYENFPGMVGEAFLRIARDAIEVDARERKYNLD